MLGSRGAFGSHRQAGAVGLGSRELSELRRVFLEILVKRIGEQDPMVLEAAFDAAFNAISHQSEAARISYRQRFENDLMDQREHRGVSANSQRQRQNCRGGKGGGPAQTANGPAGG